MPIDHEEDHGDPDQRQRRGQHALQAIDENTLHVFGIVHDARHDFSGRAILIKPDREPLKRVKHLLPELDHNALLQDVVEPDTQGVRDVLERVGQHQSAQHPRQ